MSANRGKDTKPEILLRRRLHGMGLRYRCHPRDVSGWPDVCHKGAKVAVFVDGCFWHGCPQHFKLPKTRTEFWRLKIERNKKKRELVLQELAPEWTVFQFYECELKASVEAAAAEIADAIRS